MRTLREANKVLIRPATFPMSLIYYSTVFVFHTFSTVLKASYRNAHSLFILANNALRLVRVRGMTQDHPERFMAQQRFEPGSPLSLDSNHNTTLALLYFARSILRNFCIAWGGWAYLMGKFWSMYTLKIYGPRIILFVVSHSCVIDFCNVC